MSNQRIRYATLPSNFVDGKILNAEDLNKIIRITVAGINANKADMDKILSGKSDAHIFYDLSELTPYIGKDGDYAFVFFSEDIPGPNRDTLRAYKKVVNVWVEQGEISLLSLFKKINDADITHVGVEPPESSGYSVWLKTYVESAPFSVLLEEDDHIDLSELSEVELEDLSKPTNLDNVESVELENNNEQISITETEELELEELNKPVDLTGIEEII